MSAMIGVSFDCGGETQNEGEVVENHGGYKA